MKPLIVATLLVLVTAKFVSAQPTDGFPPKASPSEAGWGFYKGWESGWSGFHQKLLDRTAKGGVDIMFLGDSLVALWDKEGKAEWDARFAPRKAANYGIGGDSTRQVIWRLENGELDNLNPKLVVLMVGTNNIYNDHNSGTDEEIAMAVEKIIGLVRAKAPTAKVLLLGVLPRQNTYFTERIANLNTVLAASASANKVPFANFYSKFLGADVINPELFKTDRVHLNAKGYSVLAAELEPVVAGLLKP